MFIAALFTLDKKWKQPKCLSTDEWIKKMFYIYIQNIHIKNKTMPFVATWMDLEIFLLN